jgi:ribonuclease VapC
LNDLLESEPLVIFADFNRELETLAADAYARFGKGRHAAQLNYGDCMTYAVAKHHDVPLLFKGADFGLTDIRIHPASVLIA